MDIPEGSIYFWMYTQGLRHVDLDAISLELLAHGKTARRKDLENYWRGYQNSSLRPEGKWDSLFRFDRGLQKTSYELASMAWDDFPERELFGGMDIMDRWVPCNKANKPMVKWGEACMGAVDAGSWPGCVYLAENMKGCNRIVVDCDGDHGDGIDMETVLFLYRLGLACDTHMLCKPLERTRDKMPEGYGDIPASFHLTFTVDRVVPTMHFPEAHIDIIGNMRNSLRYMKDKVWNNHRPVPMTPGVWDSIMEYARNRKERACRMECL